MSENHDSHRMDFNKGWQQPVFAIVIIVFVALIGFGFGLKHMGETAGECCGGEKCEMEAKSHCEKDGKACSMDAEHKGGCCKDGAEHHDSKEEKKEEAHH